MSVLVNVFTRGVLPLALVACGAGGAAAMIFGAPGAGSGEPETRATPVEVAELVPATRPALVQVSGTVEAARQVGLAPEVQGRVTWVSDRLRPGGRFEQGETLLRVDARDYQAGLASDEARLAQAELELALEEKRQLTAEREYELIGKEGQADPLALRQPHLEVARKNVRSAEAAVARARKNLARTSLRAPFNATVVTEQVDLGQFAGPTGAIATLVGTDAVRVVASIPVEDLNAVRVPGVNAEEGSKARIAVNLSREGAVVREGTTPRGGTVTREGVVTGVGGQLDPQTRTAQVVLRVDNPMVGEAPLFPGSFVDVEIRGRELDAIIAVPRAAVAGADAIWVEVDGTLVRRQVDIGWRTPTKVFVTDGLEQGDRAVVTPLAQPIEGMPLQVTSNVAQMDEG